MQWHPLLPCSTQFDLRFSGVVAFILTRHAQWQRVGQGPSGHKYTGTAVVMIVACDESSTTAYGLYRVVGIGLYIYIYIYIKVLDLLPLLFCA